jgi:Helix-turn-helix domain
MSIRVQSKVWEHSKFDGTALNLLLAIADFADDDGFAYPSIETLAKKIRRKERRTQSLIRQLEIAGELETRLGEGPKGTNLFRVKWGVQCSAPGVQSSVKRGAIQRQGGVQCTAPNPSIEEPSLTTKGSGAAEKRGRSDDPAYELFAEEFKRRHEVPYMHKRGDFVQLATLRKHLGVDKRAPPQEWDWDKAVANYFASPNGAYTLADLCTRYATFRQHALDRFKQPIGATNNATNTVPSPDTRPQHRGRPQVTCSNCCSK